MTYLPDLITLLTVAVLFGCGVAVGRARGLYKIVAPATTGHPDFERVFRVQMNTLESIVMFLPALWIAAHYSTNMLVVGGAGMLWVVARIWYAIAYAIDANKRGLGFGISILATTVLWVTGAKGVVMAMMAG